MSGRLLERWPRSWRSAALRALVDDLEFSIVSNNCWGAHVYQALELPYRTPFVGLFIPPKSYLNLLMNYPEFIRSPLMFTKKSEFDWLNTWREREGLSYPIGMLRGVVEIHFLHYGNAAEAYLKWQRRCTRLLDDPKRLFFKFDDRDYATSQDIEAFDRLPIRNKVCFTATSFGNRSVVVPADTGGRQVLDGLSLAQISRDYFNTLRWLSTRPAWLPLPSLL